MEGTSACQLIWQTKNQKKNRMSIKLWIVFLVPTWLHHLDSTKFGYFLGEGIIFLSFLFFYVSLSEYYIFMISLNSLNNVGTNIFLILEIKTREVE